MSRKTEKDADGPNDDDDDQHNLEHFQKTRKMLCMTGGKTM